MKVRKENGQIKKYSQLPKTWKNHLNFIHADEELQKQEGFYDLIIPEYNKKRQYLGDIYFDEENEIFTYLINDIVFNLDDLKKDIMLKFDVILNDFAVIIARCKFIHDEPLPEGLQIAISIAKQTRVNTINAINNLNTIEEALNFKIREDDVEYIKSLFKPYM